MLRDRRTDRPTDEGVVSRARDWKCFEMSLGALGAVLIRKLFSGLKVSMRELSKHQLKHCFSMVIKFKLGFDLENGSESIKKFLSGSFVSTVTPPYNGSKSDKWEVLLSALVKHTNPPSQYLLIILLIRPKYQTNKLKRASTARSQITAQIHRWLQYIRESFIFSSQLWTLRFYCPLPVREGGRNK